MPKDTTKLTGFQRRLVNEGDSSDLPNNSLQTLENAIVDPLTGSVSARAGSAFITLTFKTTDFPANTYSQQILDSEEYLSDIKNASIAVDSDGYLWEVSAKNANELEHIPVKIYLDAAFAVAQHARLPLAADKYVTINRIFSRLYFLTGKDVPYVLYWLNNRWNFRSDGYSSIFPAPTYTAPVTADLTAAVPGVAAGPTPSPMDLVNEFGADGNFLLRNRTTGALVVHRKTGIYTIPAPTTSGSWPMPAKSLFTYDPTISKFVLGQGIYDYTSGVAPDAFTHPGRKVSFWDSVSGFSGGESQFTNAMQLTFGPPNTAQTPAIGQIIFTEGSSAVTAPGWDTGFYAWVPYMAERAFGYNPGNPLQPYYEFQRYGWMLARISKSSTTSGFDIVEKYRSEVTNTQYNSNVAPLSLQPLNLVCSQNAGGYYLKSKIAVCPDVAGKVFVLGWRNSATGPAVTPAAAPIFMVFDTVAGTMVSAPVPPGVPAWSYADFDKDTLIGRNGKVYYFRNNSTIYYEFDPVTNGWTAPTPRSGANSTLYGPFSVVDNSGAYYGFTASGTLKKFYFPGEANPAGTAQYFKLGFSFLDDLGNESAISELAVVNAVVNSSSTVTVATRPNNNTLKRIVYLGIPGTTAALAQEPVYRTEMDAALNTFNITFNEDGLNTEVVPYSALEAQAPLPSGARFMEIYLDRVYLSGFIDLPGRTHFSEPGEPDRFKKKNAFQAGSDNLALTCLKAAPWALIFGKAQSISVLRGDPLDTAVTTAVEGVGIASNTAAMVHKNVFYFLGSDGIYSLDGYNTKNLTRELKKAELTLLLGKTSVFAFFERHFFNFMGNDGETWCFDSDFKLWDKKKYPFALRRQINIESRHGGATGTIALSPGAWAIGTSATAVEGYMKVANDDANFDLALWNAATTEFDLIGADSASFNIKIKTQKLGKADKRQKWYWLYIDCEATAYTPIPANAKMTITVTSDQASEADVFPDITEPLSRLNSFVTQGRENLFMGINDRVLGRFVECEVVAHANTTIYGMEFISEPMLGGKNDDY